MRRQPLWPSVRKELFWIYAVLAALVAEVGQSWCGEVSAYNASPWGFGVVSAPWEPGVVQSIGAWRERSRFKGLWRVEGGAREATLVQEAASLSDAAALLLGRHAKFPEVSRSAVQGQEWTVLAA